MTAANMTRGSIGSCRRGRMVMLLILSIIGILLRIALLVLMVMLLLGLSGRRRVIALGTRGAYAAICAR